MKKQVFGFAIFAILHAGSAAADTLPTPKPRPPCKPPVPTASPLPDCPITKPKPKPTPGVYDQEQIEEIFYEKVYDFFEAEE